MIHLASTTKAKWFFFIFKIKFYLSIFDSHNYKIKWENNYVWININLNFLFLIFSKYF